MGLTTRATAQHSTVTLLLRSPSSLQVMTSKTCLPGLAILDSPYISTAVPLLSCRGSPFLAQCPYPASSLSPLCTPHGHSSGVGLECLIPPSHPPQPALAHMTIHKYLGSPLPRLHTDLSSHLVQVSCNKCSYMSTMFLPAFNKDPPALCMFCARYKRRCSSLSSGGPRRSHSLGNSRERADLSQLGLPVKASLGLWYLGCVSKDSSGNQHSYSMQWGSS